MKKFTFLTFFLIVLSFTVTNAQFGAKAGTNFSAVASYGNSEEGETANLKFGYHAGAFYNYALNENINLLFELNYERRGTISKKDYSIQYPIRNPETGDVLGIGTYEVAQEANSQHHYINLPVLVMFGGEKLKYYAGPNVGFLLSGKSDFTRTIDVSLQGNPVPGPAPVDISDIDWFDYQSFKAIFSPVNVPEESGDFLNRLDVGLNVGVMYYVTPQFFVDARFNQGFLDVTNDDYDNSIYPDPTTFQFPSRSDTDRNASIQISLGYQF